MGGSIAVALCLISGSGVTDAMRHSAMFPRHPQGARVSARMASTAKQGIFAPVVNTAKTLLGKDELNALRAKVIAEHSKVISAFVDTSESPFGRIALKRLFEAADGDGSGGLDPQEVGAALKALGFSYLTEAQVAGIFERADVDKNGTIDFEEFIKETPRTLRTNLIKLAKKNGNDLGFLV